MKERDIKKVIIGILMKGYYKTDKFKADDIIKELPELDGLIKDNGLGSISCNSHPFWDQENWERRRELMQDMEKLSLKEVFANPEKYGITK